MPKKTSSQLATQSESLHHDISPQPFPAKVHPPNANHFLQNGSAPYHSDKTTSWFEKLSSTNITWKFGSTNLFVSWSQTPHSYHYGGHGWCSLYGWWIWKNSEVAWPSSWMSKLPQSPRLQGLLLWTANHRWLWSCTKQSVRWQIPQGWAKHLV